MTGRLLVAAMWCACLLAAAPATQHSGTVDGYRGIWFTLGQVSEHGDKYSGGLATYTANHTPIAVYSRQANKTFFVYGGTVRGERHLLIMASFYDHARNRVPRPTIVHDKQGVNDPHDNASIAIDDDGYIWIFISGRARARPGFIYRSNEPLNVEKFQQLAKREMTYPQPHFTKREGFFYLFTMYTAGRELYWTSSRDGRTWEPDQKLAGFGGHYQVGGVAGETIGTAFMWHPNGNVDERTNLYYVQTRDRGKTWATVDGRTVKTPLASPANETLLIDYRAQKLNVYIHDLNFDEAGRPAILYLTSRGAAAGPANDPRTWRVTRWTGAAWETADVCNSDHNYDTGSLYIDRRHWMAIGPSEPGPQPLGTGGDVAAWVSEDAGATWRLGRRITSASRFNHSYVRRPLDAAEPFSLFWADGDPNKLSESRLYFGTRSGERYWELPYDMPGDWAEPIEHSAP